MRPLNGHPLILYTLAAALDSEVFSQICVATDDPAIVALTDEPTTIFLHRRAPVADDQPDIEWVREVLAAHSCDDSFAILRPTSPFRTAAMIRRAYRDFMGLGRECSSLRAVEPVKQTPYKMWIPTMAGYMLPLLPASWEGVPLHSMPTQRHPMVWIQNSSLEMAWVTTVTEQGTIAGKTVYPFFTDGYEGFAIDTEEDWTQAERLARDHPELLPMVEAIQHG